MIKKNIVFQKLNLKFLIVLFFGISILNSTNGQNFEGVLTYELTYTPNTNRNNSSELSKMFGNVLKYYIKDGHYKLLQFDNERLISTGIYSNDDNRLYIDEAGDNTIMWLDCSYDLEGLAELNLEREQFEVNGYNCQVLTITTSTTKSTLLVTSDISVDPASFSRHNYKHFNDHLEKVNGALSLEMIISGEEYDIEMILVDIYEQKLSNKTWQLDIEKTVVPEPREFDSKAEPIKGYEKFYSYLYNNLNYPRSARKMGVEGIVYVSFM